VDVTVTNHLTRIVAGALIALALWAAALPHVSAGERARRARAFQFEQRPLAENRNAVARTVRHVNPSLQRIAGWISAVGASVALTDLDGDGLPNEACSVDPRFDEVRISSADRPDRLASFVLPLDALPYDPRTMAPTGCLAGDFNEDGRVDLLVYFWGRTPMLFLRRDAALDRAGFVAQELVANGQRWFTNAALRADIDGDGHIDLLVANYFPDGARILDAGAADSSETMQRSMTRAANGGAKHLFLWTAADRSNVSPKVTFTETDAGWPGDLSHRWTLAVGAADLDGDLRPELYFANDFGPDALLHNLSTPGRVKFAALVGQRRWRTPASKVLGRDSFKGMGVDFGDLNGDGVPDLYVSNITDVWALEESHFVFLSRPAPGAIARGIAPYADASEDLGLSRSGWAWDAKLDDFDNDGVLEAVQATGFLRGLRSRWPELQELATGNDELLANPRRWPRFGPDDDLSGHSALAFFARHADGRYYDVAEAAGLGEPHVSRGVAIADVDGDGRLDLAIANQWDRSFMYLNHAPNAGAFLGLHLRRPTDASVDFAVRPGHPRAGDRTFAAIGAAVDVSRGNTLVGSRQVDGGNGHSGRRADDLHFGLGPATTPVDVVIRWRGEQGTARTRTLRLNPGWYTVTLGDAKEK
jgi:enediyne biosynthesis protein E4